MARGRRGHGKKNPTFKEPKTFLFMIYCNKLPN